MGRGGGLRRKFGLSLNREERKQIRSAKSPLSSTESSVCPSGFTAALVRTVPNKEGLGRDQGMAFWEGWLMDATGYLEEGLLHSEAGQQN